MLVGVVDSWLTYVIGRVALGGEMGAIAIWRGGKAFGGGS